MEALAVFGIACNVMQTIDFSLKVLSMCRRISEKGTPQPDLETNSDQLRQLSTALLQSIDQARVSGTVNQEQKALREIATRLNDTIAQMAKLLDDIRIDVRNRGGAIKSMLKYKFRHKRKIEELEKAMQNYQRTLNSGILAHLCSTFEANALLSRQDFSKLDSTLQRFIQQHARDTRDLTNLVSGESASTQAHITAESSSTRRHVTENLQIRSLEQSAHVQHARLLNSLKFEEMNARRSAVKVAHTNTFEWIFDDSVVRRWDSFPQWLKSSNKNMYWISGKPGSGKSTLMKFIVGNDATQQALLDQQPPAMIVSYFFWTSGTKLQRSVKGMLGSLLRQLLREDAETISKLSKQSENIQHKESINDWSVEELEHTFLEILPTRSKTTCLFIDGLDEVDAADGQDLLIQVLERIRIQPNVKLCVSSRPETILQQSLEMYPKLRLQDLTKEDILRMIQDVLDPAAEPLAKIIPKDCTVVKDLVKKIYWKAEGVFLWAALVTRSVYQGVRNRDDWEMILKRLDILPGDMNDLYRHMWSRLNDDKEIYQEQAANYFAYFLQASKSSEHSYQSLYKFMIAFERSFDNHVLQEDLSELWELCEAVARHISVRCAGMLDISWDKKDETTVFAGEIAEKSWRTLGVHPTYVEVSFIHRSAEDFLRHTDDGKEILSLCSKTDEEICSNLVRASIAHEMFDKGLQESRPRKVDLVSIEVSTAEVNCMIWILDPETNLSQDTRLALLLLLRKSLEHLEGNGPSLRFSRLIALFGRYSFFSHLIQDMELQYHMHVDKFQNELLLCAAYFQPRWLLGTFVEPNVMLGKLQLIAHFLEAGADPNMSFWVPEFGTRNTVLSSTLWGIFRAIYGSMTKYDESFHKLLVERLQVLLNFSPDLSLKMLLFCFLRQDKTKSWR